MAVGPSDADISAFSVPETATEDLSENTHVQPLSRGNLYTGRNSIHNVVGDGQSTTAEPSIANSGAQWVGTQNWSRAYCHNSGSTWTAIPDDTGPLTAPFFCCDQDAIHDHGRDVSMYSILFVNSLSSPTTGAVRLCATPLTQAIVAPTPLIIDPGAGNLLDYPHLGLGNNFLYLTANVITNGNSWTGARRYRLNLDQVATCVSSTTNTITSSGRRVHCLQLRE